MNVVPTRTLHAAWFPNSLAHAQATPCPAVSVSICGAESQNSSTRPPKPRFAVGGVLSSERPVVQEAVPVLVLVGIQVKGKDWTLQRCHRVHWIELHLSDAEVVLLVAANGEPTYLGSWIPCKALKLLVGCVISQQKQQSKATCRNHQDTQLS